VDEVRPVVVSGDPARAEFEHFAVRVGARLRRVLSAHFGVEVGEEVTADALAWAWEHWDEVAGMGNPVGYLYRVAQSSARRYRRWGHHVVLPPEVWEQPNPPEPGLDVALAKLSAPQRVAVVLVHGLGWTYEETAESMGVPITSVRNHLHRGLIRLRHYLGEHR
jgi:RNA polymerase sigma-70 factor (ECF subfamily)